jgi:hypothetical protein
VRAHAHTHTWNCDVSGTNCLVTVSILTVWGRCVSQHSLAMSTTAPSVGSNAGISVSAPAAVPGKIHEPHQAPHGQHAQQHQHQHHAHGQAQGHAHGHHSQAHHQKPQAAHQEEEEYYDEEDEGDYEYDEDGGYYDEEGGYCDAEGGYTDKDGVYYPPEEYDEEDEYGAPDEHVEASAEQPSTGTAAADSSKPVVVTFTERRSWRQAEFENLQADLHEDEGFGEEDEEEYEEGEEYEEDDGDNYGKDPNTPTPATASQSGGVIIPASSVTSGPPTNSTTPHEVADRERARTPDSDYDSDPGQWESDSDVGASPPNVVPPETAQAAVAALQETEKYEEGEEGEEYYEEDEQQEQEISEPEAIVLQAPPSRKAQAASTPAAHPVPADNSPKLATGSHAQPNVKQSVPQSTQQPSAFTPVKQIVYQPSAALETIHSKLEQVLSTGITTRLAGFKQQPQQTPAQPQAQAQASTPQSERRVSFDVADESSTAASSSADGGQESELAKKCRDLEMKLQRESEEKSRLLSEMKKLQEQAAAHQHHHQPAHPHGHASVAGHAHTVEDGDATDEESTNEDAIEKMVESMIKSGMMAILWCFRTLIVKKYALAFNRWKLSSMSASGRTRGSPRLVHKTTPEKQQSSIHPHHNSSLLNEYAESDTDFGSVDSSNRYRNHGHGPHGHSHRGYNHNRNAMKSVPEQYYEAPDTITNASTDGAVAMSLEEKYKHVLDSSDDEAAVEPASDSRKHRDRSHSKGDDVSNKSPQSSLSHSLSSSPAVGNKSRKSLPSNGNNQASHDNSGGQFGNLGVPDTDLEKRRQAISKSCFILIAI